MMSSLASSVSVEGPSLAELLAESDALGVHTTVDDILRHAVVFARQRLGLERVAIYLRDSGTKVMRGSWGTGLSGETTDERSHTYPDLCATALNQLLHQGLLWKYCPEVPLRSVETLRTNVVAHGWLAVTPLLAGHNVLGVMYNDSALTGAVLDERKQERAALWCGLLANLVHGRQSWAPRIDAVVGVPVTRMVRQVVTQIDQVPTVSGQELARDLGVSPGHLARCFKGEMGLSMVEYRNRLRLRRFFERVEGGEVNLIKAALGAGFGSYAQFHRVYRQLLGGTPRDVLSRRGGVSRSSTLV